MRYHLAVFPSFPIPWLAGQTATSVFVMVNEAQRYLATRRLFILIINQAAKFWRKHYLNAACG
jgi:hypothetical protein